MKCNANPSAPNQSLKSTTIVALMIAAAGLTSSVASAQFKFDRSKNDEKQAIEIHEIVVHEEPKEVTKSTSTNVIKVSDNDHVYDIKFSDGRVISAVVDGDNFDLDRVKFDGEFVRFVGDDGEEVLYEISLPPQVFSHHAHQAHQAHGHHSPDVNHEVTAWVSGDNAHAQHQFEWKSDGLPPKVMLGFYLGEPSAALRKHLSLPKDRGAIMVERVIKGLPAALAGMQDFDVIISIDGSDEADSKMLNKILSSKEAGDQLKVYVLRGGKKVKLNVELKAYDAESMKQVEGYIIQPDFPAVPVAPRFPQVQEQSQNKAFRFEIDRERLGKGIGEIEFEFFNKLDDGEFGNLPKPALEKLKRELKIQLDHLGQNQIHVERIQKNALEAMKGAERQMLELREGKLMVRDLAELKHELARGAPEALHEHVDGLEHRLEGLEKRLDEQMERMDRQMDRLADMLERLMDRLDD